MSSQYMYAFIITVLFDKEEENREKGHRFVTFLPSEAMKILQKLGLADEDIEVNDSDKNAFSVPLNALASLINTPIYSHRTVVNRM